MYILTIRTDNPTAEIGVYADKTPLTRHAWHAHRELSDTIHVVIKRQFNKSDLDMRGMGGIVLYVGPGSFTGLRIGASVANALADSLGVPIVGTTGDVWESDGIELLLGGENEIAVMPEYGSEPHITPPRK